MADRRGPMPWDPGVAIGMPCQLRPVYPDRPLDPGSRPICQEQETIDGRPTSPTLRCYLPAGHHSQEHYDRTFALVWRHLNAPPDTRPEQPRPADAPWH